MLLGAVSSVVIVSLRSCKACGVGPGTGLKEGFQKYDWRRMYYKTLCNKVKTTATAITTAMYTLVDD